MKTCNKCGVSKDYSCFNKRKSGSRDGYFWSCKECYKIVCRKYRQDCPNATLEYHKRYYAKNREKLVLQARQRNRRRYVRTLKTRYHLSLADYQSMLSAQNNECAICKRPQTALLKRLVVDHNHQNGKVRGLLCQTCNRAIGLLKDSKSFIQNALDYMEKSDETSKEEKVEAINTAERLG